MFINYDSSIPIYSQIAEIIEDQILKGDLKENQQVFSTNQLAKLLNINPATARKGLNLLIDEEIIYKKRGLGMFVSTGAAKKIKVKRSRSFFTDYIESMIKEAKKLGLTRKDIINMINSCEWRD